MAVAGCVIATGAGAGGVSSRAPCGVHVGSSPALLWLADWWCGLWGCSPSCLSCVWSVVSSSCAGLVGVSSKSTSGSQYLDSTCVPSRVTTSRGVCVCNMCDVIVIRKARESASCLRHRWYLSLFRPSSGSVTLHVFHHGDMSQTGMPCVVQMLTASLWYACACCAAKFLSSGAQSTGNVPSHTSGAVPSNTARRALFFLAHSLIAFTPLM
jgi:hypothetical protein